MGSAMRIKRRKRRGFLSRKMVLMGERINKPGFEHAVFRSRDKSVIFAKDWNEDLAKLFDGKQRVFLWYVVRPAKKQATCLGVHKDQGQVWPA